MAAFWRLYSRWRKIRYSHFKNSYVVHLYLFFDDGIADNCIYDHGILDEHQTIHPFC